MKHNSNTHEGGPLSAPTKSMRLSSGHCSLHLVVTFLDLTCKDKRQGSVPQEPSKTLGTPITAPVYNESACPYLSYALRFMAIPRWLLIKGGAKAKVRHVPFQKSLWSIRLNQPRPACVFNLLEIIQELLFIRSLSARFGIINVSSTTLNHSAIVLCYDYFLM